MSSVPDHKPVVKRKMRLMFVWHGNSQNRLLKSANCIDSVAHSGYATALLSVAGVYPTLARFSMGLLRIHSGLDTKLTASLYDILILQVGGSGRAGKRPRASG